MANFEEPEAFHSIFRLLVRSNGKTTSSASWFDAAGDGWTIADYEDVPEAHHAPHYLCVTYSWGRGRTQNQFDPTRFMSSRALPALQSAITTMHPLAIWFDAACMPPREPARELCLRSMGAIYAAANSVLAVLSPSSSGVLEKVRRDEALDIQDVISLESDEWVSRVWTYQEIANSQIMNFVAEGETQVPVPGNKLLNAIGRALSDFRKVTGVDAYEFRKKHPRIDGLETLIDDWLRSDYEQRSAYQVMTAMSGRTAVYPDDNVYAMIGAVSTTSSDKPEDVALEPSEYFMQVCERKGDFSFIYSQAPRALGPGGSWRPRRGPISPIVPWPSAGERQEGLLTAGLLHLHNVVKVELGRPGDAARMFIHDWLRKTVLSPLPPDMSEAVYKTLRRADFTGHGEYVETTCGLFFPQHSLGSLVKSIVFVTKNILFNFGAPGLLVEPVAEGKVRIRDIGVFVGPVPAGCETLVIV